MSIRGVAFDLDYTLAVPNRDRKTLLQEAVDKAGAPPITRNEYLSAHRHHLTTESRTPIFAELLNSSNDNANNGNSASNEPTDPEQLAAAYRDAVTNALVPIPDAEDLITSLRAEYRVGLLTNGPVRAQRSKIEFLGWEPLFDTTLVTGELSAGKPDPKAFAALLSELGTAANETVYIGDTPHDDIKGATDAGIYAIQVLFDDGPDRDPRADSHLARDQLAVELPKLLASL